MSSHSHGPSMLGRFVNEFEETAIAVILGLMTLITFVNVMLRYIFNTGLIWGLEATTILFAWLVLFGISYAVKVTAHLGVDAVISILPHGVRRVTVLSAGMGIAPAVPLVRDLREAGLAVRAVHFRPEPGEPPLWDEARALGFEREGDLDVALRERPPGAVYAAGPRGFVASLGERLEVLGHDGAAFVEEVGPGPVPVPAAPPPPSEPPGCDG